jgi:hypothetical protein
VGAITNFLLKSVPLFSEKGVISVVDFISKLLWGIVCLRNYYNLKNNSHHINLTLESINNRLNIILSKIKLVL